MFNHLLFTLWGERASHSRVQRVIERLAHSTILDRWDVQQFFNCIYSLTERGHSTLCRGTWELYLRTEWTTRAMGDILFRNKRKKWPLVTIGEWFTCWNNSIDGSSWNMLLRNKQEVARFPQQGGLFSQGFLSVGAELAGELPFQVLPFHKMSREHMISYPNVRIYTTNFNTIY